ncbi:MAG: MmcQ/YjbR family DNA-binding protein [Deltaproteobacteria bacterium]|nr:MmcQ/YjbR family DNA-binding protein [Deltaproteobacteria bacterium]
MSARRLRELALSFDGAYEVAHVDRAAFRTSRRIFATLAPDGASANLLFDLPAQQAVCDALPHAFEPVPGGWGRMGYTTVHLDRVSEAQLASALAEAYARALPRARAKAPRTAPRAAPKKVTTAPKKQAAAKPKRR